MEANKTNHEGKENLRDENAFLKMKLMLEHGASFKEQQGKDLPPELENMFLQNVMAFEEQFAKNETTKVYEAIGRPTHFLPAAEVADDDIHDAWNELLAHLNRHGINLSACSPKVTERELYRFTLEELFDHEMMAIDLPGWQYNFIYDEFHPDPVYEARQTAENWAIRPIFSKNLMDQATFFVDENLRLNLYHSLSRDTLKKIINRFKESFDEIYLTSVTKVAANVNEREAVVTGNYRAKCVLGNERLSFRGQWKVELVKDKDATWLVKGLEIEGIEF